MLEKRDKPLWPSALTASFLFHFPPPSIRPINVSLLPTALLFSFFRNNAVLLFRSRILCRRVLPPRRDLAVDLGLRRAQDQAQGELETLYQWRDDGICDVCNFETLLKRL